jgi:DNA-binding winged helix-turn-helix (wHTH) protein
MSTKTQGMIRFGDFELDVAERTLKRTGMPVAVSPKAFDLLALLAETPGKLRTKQELLDAIWADTSVEEATLGRHISDLRRALGKDQPYIETVTRHGYRFLPETSPPKPGYAPVEPPPPAQKRSHLIWVIATACCLLAYAGVRLVPARSASAKNPADQDVIRLTNNVASDGQPDWSPDGSKVVFVSNRDGLPAIWAMSADGSNQRNLTARLGWADSPAWSPDGTRVAFQRKRGTQPEIFVMNADGTEPRALGVFGARASWAPDSGQIAFQCFDGTHEQICSVAPDGSNYRMLTHFDAFAADPSRMCARRHAHCVR